MRARLSLLLGLAVGLCLGSSSTSARPRSAPGTLPIPTEDPSSVILSSHGRLGSRSIVAEADSVDLYGGRLSTEGKFQDPTSGLPNRQGWVGVDETDQDGEIFWQRSIFNAEALGYHGVGNHALWCGRDPSQAPGWVTPPGYGNDWCAIALWESEPLSDPSVGQTVGLDFLFHHDTEPSYDFFRVEYDSAGVWTSVMVIDGSNRLSDGSFPAPGLRFEDVALRPIVFIGSDYGAGVEAGRIRIRFVVESDPIWSDEDGNWPTTAGAVQIDDVTVVYRDGTGPIYASVEDFEGPGPYAIEQELAPFAGEFSKLGIFPTAVDPCARNTTAVVHFIDDGTPPSNPRNDPPRSTGGAIAHAWPYAGGYGVNYFGGLTFGEQELDDWIWSPPIAFDAPGSVDDGPDWVGLALSYDVWPHMPLSMGMFYRWGIRASTDGGSTWRAFSDGEFLLYSQQQRWRRDVFDVTNLIPAGTTHVQIRLGVQDWAEIFGFPSDDASPAPWFDNVRLTKFRVSGPMVATRLIDLPNDGFPNVSELDVSTAAARDLLDVPFDMAQDVNLGGNGIYPGDSITVDVAARPGSQVDDVRMRWILERNPLFDDVRALPMRAHDQFVDPDFGSGQWYGEVLGQPVVLPGGAQIEGRWFFDLPDEDFLYPGDELRILIVATDDQGSSSTLPVDDAGFIDGVVYDRNYVVHALPSIHDDQGRQAEILIINDVGANTIENEYVAALRDYHHYEREDFDIYTAKGASWRTSNGIGAWQGHGATAQQLAGYEVIFYEGGSLSALLGDGSNQYPSDKSDDVGVLTDWHDLDGPRYMAHFADNLFSSLSQLSTGAGILYMDSILSAEWIASSVRDYIDGQRTPQVEPEDPWFFQSFVADGGCPSLNDFDAIAPVWAGTRTHGWLSPGGWTYPQVAAGIKHGRLVNGWHKIDLSFPFGIAQVIDSRNRSLMVSARSRLLQEILCLFHHCLIINPSPPELPTTFAAVAQPNPFNARLVIELSQPREEEGSVRVVDLRGQMVRVLHHGTIPAGVHRIEWDGRDDGGSETASGIYFIEVVTERQRKVLKVAQVK